MKKKGIIILLFLLISVYHLTAQPLERRGHYDINKDKVLYTIGYAHLDTEWNWEYPTTINQYIKNTMEDNFKLFEKYPDYVFNFTGSRRYKMMKEYYPESFKKVTDYIRQGRWFISGSSVDEGEVNISSSESIIRQVLYGNQFFRHEFSKESYDYMLPDCFGFVATLPQVLNHAGLLGFSTQKLTWRSANGIPFNVGIWEAPDGKNILAALNATSYTSNIEPRLDINDTWNTRLQDNINKYGISFDFRYYGVGDVGGAPREEDVVNGVASLRNPDSKFKVVLTSSDQMFKDITPELREKLPAYSGDLLLIEHSAGSLTSQSFMKRANRKNEILARNAEMASVMADWLGGSAYPFVKINNAWELVLGSQFHDILPGTSTPKAYEYAWNDEFIVMNSFAEVLKNAVGTISKTLNTQVDGRAIIVFNPVAREREEIVTVELPYSKLPVNVRVTDKNGNYLPSQIISAKDNKLKMIFLAKLPSGGFSVFGIQEAIDKYTSSELSVTERTLENKYFLVRIDDKGDIVSIYDKRAAREVLSKPATLDFQKENPTQWPAWNMDWKDRKNPPFDYLNKNTSIRIIESGPVRVALEVKREGQNSKITQIISLSAGESGKVIEVNNKIDWQSKGVSLKAAFPTTVENEFATYSLNTAAIQRTTNNEVKFEVPGRQWIDITDRSNNYGVSILEDCKYGSDKPDNSTLRLTLMYTPTANSYYYQGTQDWGIHDFKYAIYPHVGDWKYAKTPWMASNLNNPAIAFETSKHDGQIGKELSIIKINKENVDIMALKKSEESDFYIVRVNELYGKEVNNVVLSFPARIIEAFEVNGQEKRIGNANCSDGNLNFEIGKYAIRSFAIKFENSATKFSKPVQQFISLPYNEDGFSFDTNRKDGNVTNNLTIPAELIPPEVVSEDIVFQIGNKSDNQKNMLSVGGQKINLPEGEYNKLYILAAATEDTYGQIKTGNKSFNILFQNWTGFIGQHYGRDLYFNNMKVASIKEAFVKKDNIAWFSSHCHSPEGNNAYQYSYLYKYEVELPRGTKTVVLPNNPKIKIFAMTVSRNNKDDIIPLQNLYDDFKDNKPIKLRVNEIVTSDLKPLNFYQVPLFTEKVDERMMPRLKRMLINAGMDTTIVITPPSSNDYADVNSGNKVTAFYYPFGRSSKGIDYSGQPIDISNILDSRTGTLKDTLFFDNGEGRIVIDLKKPISVDRINIYFETSRPRGQQTGAPQAGSSFSQMMARGQQIFSIWASSTESDITGDPKSKGWQYVGYYNSETGRGIRTSGISYIFNNNLKCKYLMFISDGTWHGTDYFKQIDIFEVKK